MPPAARPGDPARRHEPKALRARRQRTALRRAGASAAAALLMAGVAYAVLSAGPGSGPAMPAYAHRTADVEAAYTFAHSDAGESLQWIPCYCGCGTHSGHDNNRDCFVKPDGTGFDEHGSQCDVCVDIALRVKRGQADGQSLQEIRASVDAAYAGYLPTDTSMPP